MDEVGGRQDDHFTQYEFNNACRYTWGAVIPSGRSRVRFPIVSLEFFIDIIVSAAL